MKSHIAIDLQTLIAAAVEEKLALRFKPIFGSIMTYVEDRPFCSLSDVGTGIKLGEPSAVNFSMTRTQNRFSTARPIRRANRTCLDNPRRRGESG
jgi:hypothetical protein